jgi:glycine/D-amino acid oxidase-like deaminating enzyme
VIVGGGVFGATAALELRRRGATVMLLDPGPLPHPDAASTDISKLVRLDYGADAFYAEQMEVALAEWRRWNEGWSEPLFHETGILVLSGEAMSAGSFEGDSYALLSARGHRLERLDSESLPDRFPAFRRGRYRDGYYNPRGGWAESGRVVSALLADAEREGVIVRGGVRVLPIDAAKPKLEAVESETGERFLAGAVVVAAGAFTPVILPELADRLTVIGQPVLHFAPADLEAFRPPAFVPWAADIARTGWYGFSAHAGVVKIANHGPGVRVDPAAPRLVPDGAEARFRTFLQESLPGLASASRVRERLCLYCDSFDGDFFIDRHPTCSGLVVASGGSGHAFKFAPLLGPMIADAVDGSQQGTARFRWRARSEGRAEVARYSSS